MLNNGNNSKCEFTGEIVSYLYNESGTSQRRIFEKHLADCTVCTDEFAAISNARFSVFEWQKEAFAHLLTPEIVIPYGSKKGFVQAADDSGFWAGLRRLVSFPSLPMAITAALLLCIGMGFVTIAYFGGRQGNTIADIGGAVPPVERSVLPSNVPAVLVTSDHKTPGKTMERVSKNGPANRSTLSNSTVANNRGIRQEKFIRAENRKLGADIASHDPTAQPRKPVLTTDAETDDRSLRLSDLFDEDGGGS